MADDGLQWLLSLDVEQEEALGLLKTIDKLSKGLGTTKTETEKVEHATKKAGDAHKKHGEDAEHLEGALSHLRTAALDPLLKQFKQYAEFEFVRQGIERLIEIPGEIIEKLKELGEEMVNVAAKTERTNTSFSLLFGKAEGSEVLEYLEKIAGATEFTDERLKGAAQTLAKVGFAGQGLTRAMAASLDIAAFSPNKEEGFGEALASLERIKRTGRVDNRVLGGLGVGEKSFLKELSARTGEDLATLKKKLETGKVDAEAALETLYTLIARKTGKDLGGAGVEVGKGLEAKLTHLKDLPEQFFQKLAKTDAFDKLTAAADRLLEKLNPESATGKKLFEALEAGASAVVDAIDGIDVDQVGAALVSLADDVKPVIDVFLALGRAVAKTASGLEAIANSNFGHVIGVVGRGAGTVLKGAGGAFLDSTGVGTMLNYLTAKADPVEQAGKKLGSATGKGVAVGVKESTPEAKAAVGDMATGASDAGAKALGVHSPSRVFADLGRMTAAGFVQGIDASAADVDKAVESMFETPRAPPAATASGIAARGGITVAPGAVVLTIHVPEGTGLTAEAVGEIAARAVESALPGAFKSGLDQMAAQGGEN